MARCDDDLRTALEMAEELSTEEDSQIPVDLFRLGRRLGVCDIEPREMSAEGYLGTSADGRLVIRYRADRSRVRTRFTIAHELGHILLGKVQGKLDDLRAFRAEGGSTQEEIAVNRIASELLMPKRVVLRLLKRQPVNWWTIYLISRSFGVSVSASVRRILEVEGLPAFWMALPIKSGHHGYQEWKLRASNVPEVRFLEPIPRLARRVCQNAIQSKTTFIEADAVGLETNRLRLRVACRLMDQIGPPEYWCVSWCYLDDHTYD